MSPPPDPPDPRAGVRAGLARAISSLGGDATAETSFERPPDPGLGDFSTNAAMVLAPVLRSSPRDIAGRLAEAVASELGDDLADAQVAGPGFLNLRLSDSWCRRAVGELLEADARLGESVSAAPERVLVEFVSANPTGPLTAAGGRHAAFGDALARILEHAGHSVEREYYVNDFGTQIRLFGASIAARRKGERVPEGGYEGDYVAGLAEELSDVDPGDAEALERRGVEAMVGHVRETLERFGVAYTRWFSERSLHDAGVVDEVLDRLRDAGHAYERENALWLRSTAFGDDKDRVLRRQGGETTYLAADLAYHEDKLSRGHDRLIDVWGADHHGYVARVRAGIEALGGEPDRFEVVIMQLVNIVERGERARMSKRRGEFVTLDELIDDIGTDAARFFLLQRSHDTALDLDLDLAREQSRENPVYYVQYAHARICSILEKAGREKVEAALADPPGPPVDPSERALVLRLTSLPGEVREAAARRAPHRLTAYSMSVAADFHAFYRDCQVVGAPGDGVEAGRLAVCEATRRTIAVTLGLLGVSAPESM